MKKFFKLFFAASVLASIHGYSFEYAGNCAPYDNRYDCPEPCTNWYITADYLYWRANVENLEFAVSGVDFPPDATGRGELKDLDWEWNSGFKAGIGYLLPCCWDLYLNYTWYHTHVQGSATSDITGDLFATFAPSDGVTSSLNAAEADFTLRYNTLDLELGNSITLSPNFVFRPSIGLRGAWTKDFYDISYDPITSIGQDVNHEETFYGVGPRIGLNATWFFCDRWSFFGEGAYSLLWGRYETTLYSTAFSVRLMDLKKEYDAIRQLTDMKIGIGWDHCIRRFPVHLQLAWEHRIWLKYNQYPRFVDDIFVGTNLGNASDLSLYGLTLSARLDF